MNYQQLPFALTMSTEALVGLLTQANNAYRSGSPIMSDDQYDHTYLAELKRRDANHPYLHAVEPEPLFGTVGGVRHKRPMLSTQKSFTIGDAAKWVARIEKAAQELGVAPVLEAKAKLDGMAGRYEGGVLASRGDGLVGSDLSHMIERGVVAIGGENTGDGEIVMESAYFERELAEDWSHPRNCVTGICGADTIKDKHLPILASGAIRFVPYSSLPSWQGSPAEFLANYDAVYEQASASEYPVDGVVVSCVNPEIQGSSRFSGEGGLDLEEEVSIVSITIGHAFDDFDAIIHAFKDAGVERIAGAGDDPFTVRPQLSCEGL